MKMKLQVCAAILPPFCQFCQSKNASDISPIRSIKVALLGSFCKHSRATTLLPFVQTCYESHAPAILPILLDQTCSCPFARQIEDDMLTPPSGRFEGNSTATMLLTFGR